jgi:hypothetical protein
MIKTILTATAIALTSTPVLADTVQSPKTTQAPSANSFGFSSLGGTTPPALTLYAISSTSNISCRSKARSKYFELGARDMSKDDSNAQWATVGTMQAVVWCRDTQAIIAVAGSNQTSVVELRDEIAKAF